jgi:hypothetical protein
VTCSPSPATVGSAAKDRTLAGPRPAPGLLWLSAKPADIDRGILRFLLRRTLEFWFGRRTHVGHGRSRKRGSHDGTLVHGAQHRRSNLKKCSASAAPPRDRRRGRVATEVVCRTRIARSKAVAQPLRGQRRHAWRTSADPPRRRGSLPRGTGSDDSRNSSKGDPCIRWRGDAIIVGNRAREPATGPDRFPLGWPTSTDHRRPDVLPTPSQPARHRQRCGLGASTRALVVADWEGGSVAAGVEVVEARSTPYTDSLVAWLRKATAR